MSVGVAQLCWGEHGRGPIVCRHECVRSLNLCGREWGSVLLYLVCVCVWA